MTLTKNEFKTLVMLYAANIDGKIQPEEVEVMLEKADETSFQKMNKLFKKMGDAEIIDCIRANKEQYISSADDSAQLMDDFRSVIEADEKCSQMETYLFKAIEKILI